MRHCNPSRIRTHNTTGTRIDIGRAKRLPDFLVHPPNHPHNHSLPPPPPNRPNKALHAFRAYVKPKRHLSPEFVAKMLKAIDWLWSPHHAAEVLPENGGCLYELPKFLTVPLSIDTKYLELIPAINCMMDSPGLFSNPSELVCRVHVSKPLLIEYITLCRDNPLYPIQQKPELSKFPSPPIGDTSSQPPMDGADSGDFVPLEP